MKITMVVCLCFVSTGVSATEPQVCVNVSVTPDEGPSPQYPVANGSLTELVIHAPKKDFGSVAVFLGPECLLQLRQLGAPGGWTCLFALPLHRRIALVFERNTSALSVFERQGCSLKLVGEVPPPAPSLALSVVPRVHSVLVSYDCFWDEPPASQNPASCPSRSPWVLSVSALSVALLVVLVVCPLRGRVQEARRGRRDPNPVPEQTPSRAHTVS